MHDALAVRRLGIIDLRLWLLKASKQVHDYTTFIASPHVNKRHAK
jgi:hypothetical protein